MVACNATQVEKPVNDSVRNTKLVKNCGFLSGTTYIPVGIGPAYAEFFHSLSGVGMQDLALQRQVATLVLPGSG